MKILLDTHIWIWSLLEPPKLVARVSKAIQDDGNELWLSPISAWEFLMLCEKKRISVADPRAWVRKALQDVQLHEAPLTHDVALMSHDVSLPHQDPADRFLVATALTYELTLATADERLIDSAKCKILANR